MIRIAVVALAAALLSGCQTLSVVDDARDKAGAAAMDYLCNRMTLREWRERFGRHSTAAQGWIFICAQSGPLVPMLPPKPAEPGKPKIPA